jgi:formamidopyrimidine-DNA glycosylase
MPEGPEVRKTANMLSHELVSKTLVKIKINGGASKESNTPIHVRFRRAVASLNALAARENTQIKFTKVASKGKYLYIEIQNLLLDPASGHWKSVGYKYLGCHMMLTGKWRTEPPPRPGVEILYRDSSSESVDNVERVYFDDARRLGYLELLTRPQLDAVLDSMGPDILGKMTPKTFRTQLSRSGRAALANALHNQQLISGIGNYLRSDILWSARLAPDRKVNSLTDAEWKRLYEAARSVTRESCNSGATSYYTGAQTPGYQFRVYKQTHDPKGNPVQTKKYGSQTVYWVPRVQS